MAVANEWIKKSYTGAAVATTLNGAISGVTTAVVLTNGATYPDGTGGPFVICMDRGLGTEEKMICSARSGNNVTVLQRGYDGTAAVGHANAAPVEHVLDAWSIDQAAAAAAAATTVGDLSIRSGAFAYARLAPGAAGLVVVSNGVGVAPSYGQVGAAGVSAAAIAAINAGLLKADGTVQATALLSYSSALNPVGVNDIPRKAYVDAAVAAEAALRVTGDATPARIGTGLAKSSQAIPHNTLTSLAYDNEVWDSSTFYAGVGNTSIAIPATMGGVYAISVQTSSPAASSHASQISVNGVAVVGGIAIGLPLGAPTALIADATLIRNFVAGDTISVQVFQNTGSPVNIGAVVVIARISI